MDELLNVSVEKLTNMIKSQEALTEIDVSIMSVLTEIVLGLTHEKIFNSCGGTLCENAADDTKGMLREGEPLIGGITKAYIPLDKNGMSIFKPMDLIGVISFTRNA